jgi:hypothetical protein
MLAIERLLEIEEAAIVRNPPGRGDGGHALIGTRE